MPRAREAGAMRSRPVQVDSLCVEECPHVLGRTLWRRAAVIRWGVWGIVRKIYGTSPKSVNLGGKKPDCQHLRTRAVPAHPAGRPHDWGDSPIRRTTLRVGRRPGEDLLCVGRRRRGLKPGRLCCDAHSIRERG